VVLSEPALSAGKFFHFSGTKLQFQPAVLPAGLAQNAGWWEKYPVVYMELLFGAVGVQHLHPSGV
jgi:hypothetical protein